MPENETRRAERQARIEEAALLLGGVINTQPSITAHQAKHELRKAGLYTRIQDVTLDRIGKEGANRNLFIYVSGEGFRQIGTAVIPHQRDYIDEWANDTMDGDTNEKKGACRRWVQQALTDINDPTVKHDCARDAQVLHGLVGIDSPVLGSYRSFCRWGIEKGYFTGNVDLIWKNPDMTDRVSHGIYTAWIPERSMTDTQDRWPWQVRSQDGSFETRYWAKDADGIRSYLSQLCKNRADELDMEEMDLVDQLDQLDPENTPYFDEGILTGRDHVEEDYVASMMGGRAVPGNTGEYIRIPRHVALRMAELTDELGKLLKVYLD